MRKLALLILILIPYIAIIMLLKSFVTHYNYLTTLSSITNENMYFLGCAENSSKSFEECHNKAKEKSL